MLPFLTFTPLCRSLSGRMAFFAVSFLLCFGVENGLAKTIKQHSIWCISGDKRYPMYSWFSADSSSSIFEQFPFLSKLDRQGGSLGGVYYFPYGTQINSSSSPNFPALYYYDVGAYSDITVPDTVTDNDLNSINEQYLSLSAKEQAAITGLTIAHVSHEDGSYEDVSYFNHRNIGSFWMDGVITYDKFGNVVLSSASGTGYATGYERQVDGTYTPVYYHLASDGTITKQDVLPTSDYSSLTYDSATGQYSLSVPDYSSKLDTIIDTIDNIDFSTPSPVVNVNPEVNVTVPPPEVTVNPEITVNPEVNVTVPTPEITVNPEVTVIIPDTLSSQFSQANNTLSNILDSVEGDASGTAENFQDLTLTSEEQSLVARYVDWETNIPLIGDALDVGLTTLLGRIPNVGTEYLWLDYTIGGASPSAGASGRRSSSLASASNPLAGYNIRIDLINYRDILLAARGGMILFEALYFCMLTLKCIRQALSV